ncbi:MAG: hypothetical protein LBK26_00680 [Rickettsiales bacterium]|jgi:outer membrane protein assembly factor BamE (lipoprotein component of BamABCDE complex)|nr:hypothetical protein [Rickettsiales bacterium]
MKKVLNFVFRFSFLVALFCAGCTFQTKHRGYIFPEDAKAQLTDVKTTADLEKKFGSPNARTIYGKPVWIYYGADENQRGPFPLTYSNKQILLAWIDPAVQEPGNARRVIQTKILTDKDFPDVDLADGATPIPAEIQLNAFEELINNIGRFSPAGLGQ